MPRFLSTVLGGASNEDGKYRKKSSETFVVILDITNSATSFGTTKSKCICSLSS
jgi:hypothetical protein